MANSFFSSKSLLSKIGQENNLNDQNNNSENLKDTSLPEEEPAGFLLAATLDRVKEPASKNLTYLTAIEHESDPNTDNEPPTDESPIVLPVDEFNNESDDDERGIVMEATDAVPISNKSKTLELMKLLNPSNLLKLHDLLLSSFYEEHKYELITQTKLIMRVITWNLSQLKPPNLTELAGENSREWAAFFYAGDTSEDTSEDTSKNEDGSECLADIYIINFQETISLKSFSKSDDAINDWVKFLLSVLNALSFQKYRCVCKTGLLGLTTIILAVSHLTVDGVTGDEGQIHDIRQNSIGLGYLRWANKGCISVRFRIGGVSCGIGSYDNYTSFLNDENLYNISDLDETVGKIPGVEVQLLNVHLVHGEGDAQVKQRWDSWSKIQKKIGLNDRTVTLADDPQDYSYKNRAQKRLERKLRTKLKKKSLEEDEEIEEDLEKLDINSEAVRSCNVPVHISKTEKDKFGDSITEVDIDRFTNVSEALKVLVICGDSNYRLSLPSDNSTRERIYGAVKNAAWGELLQNDQLLNQMNASKIMVGLTEAPIKFAPTFKIFTDSYGKWVVPTPPMTPVNEGKSIKGYKKPPPGTGTPSADIIENKEHPYYVPRYDTKRLPAYTDRILYAERPYFDIISDSYHSVPLKGSDHLPVTASYTLDAPLVDNKKLHRLKNRFTGCWEEIINKLKFMSFEQSIYVERTFIAKSDVGEIDLASPVKEILNFNGGHINIEAIAGETINITLNVKNLVDEAYRLSVVEQSSRGWFGTKIGINCREFQSEGHVSKEKLPSCRIEAYEKAHIELSFTSSSVETLNRTFVVEIPEYEKCPEYRKYFAITATIYDIFHTSFEQLNEDQFLNILSCLDFIYGNPVTGLVDRMEQIGNPSDLKTVERDLVREITLWKFDSSKYKELNDSNTNQHQNNYGTITVLAVVYAWMKTQGSAFNIRSHRGKTFFSEVIKLIKYLNLDAVQGYAYFGWLFMDENELEEYLERDFDVKLQL